MRRRAFIASVILIALALATRLAAGPAAAPDSPGPVLTAEEIFRSASLGQAELSPDGQRLGAIIHDDQDQRHLLIFDLKDRKHDGVRATADFEMSTFRWLGNDRVLFNVTRDKLYSWGLYSAKIDRLGRNYPINTFDVTEIIGVPEARPGRVLVWIVQSAENDGRPGGLLEFNADRAPGAFDAGRRHAAVVRSYPAPKNGSVIAWRANRQGELALAITWAAGQAHLHRYHRERELWSEVKLDLKTVTPMGLDTDERFLWVVTHAESSGYELRRYDLETGVLAEPVLTDANYDPSEGRMYFGERDGELAGISYTQRQATTVWFSPEYATVQALVDQSYPQTANVLVDRDRAERKFLFLLTGPQQPGTYALLDMETKTLGTVASAAPWLKERPLLAVQPISFRTRDGVKLEGYLTLPAGASEQRPAPLVVLAHGGPWVRTTADFDPEVQFLASRGYAVLQPNYRGSSGYAPAISREHEFDFGRMHEDVTDATRAMIRSPLIDPQRVAIMGGSFGGYLALAGVTSEVGLYRCAITTCGVFDWERLIKSKRRSARPAEYEMLVDRLGRPGRDRERLEQISPLRRADQIQVPVLIAHGSDDRVVDIAQSRKLAAALKKRGVPHETFYRAVEGHGFYNYKNRVEYYHRVEAFLAANLGGVSLVPIKPARR